MASDLRIIVQRDTSAEFLAKLCENFANLGWSDKIAIEFDLEETPENLMSRENSNAALQALNELIAAAQSLLLKMQGNAKKVTLLSRMTIPISSKSSIAHISGRLSERTLQVAAIYPNDEKSFQTSCTSLGKWVVISLNLTVRLGFVFKPSIVEYALARGRVFEINYGPMIRGSSAQRRSIVCNATALSRATGGRGLILSSSVSRLIDARPPKDVINLAQFMLGITSSNKLQAMLYKLPNRVVESSQAEKFMNTRQNMWSIVSPSHGANQMIEKIIENSLNGMEIDGP